MTTEPTIPAAIIEKAAKASFESYCGDESWEDAVYADIQADTLRGNSGRIVTAEFSDGINYPLVGCEECDCQLHDDPPKPAGIYATIRFDDDSTRIGISRRVVMVELGGGKP